MQDEIFARYVQDLRNAYAQAGTELSGRAALESLLKAAAGVFAPTAHIQHEPPRQGKKGSPDFMVSQVGMILGYVENKTIGEDLGKVLKSPQIKKYQELSNNLLLTDYLHFIWIRDGSIQRENLAYPEDLEDHRFSPKPANILAVTALLKGFFSTPPEGIGRAQQLALALATRSQMLRDFLGEELVRQEKEHREGRLYGLYDVFQKQVFHELTLKEFADAFAQTLSYGLFLARLNAGQGTAIDLNNVRQFIPNSISLIRELANFLDVLENEPYGDIRWVVREILSITNGLDLAAIHEDLSFANRKVRRGIRAKSEEEARLFERDPFVYFYEDFLARYDPAVRETRGVYYTPPPVVNFIVRAVDDILKDGKLFAIRDGLADHRRVTVLDFACGTGSFLVEVFEKIFENIGGADSGKAELVKSGHLLKNIYGFEYLIAPYTIAHLKLSQYLADKGVAIAGGERLQVFLTNTLEPIEPQKNLLLPELSHEVEEAQKVKDQPILVILGNPPYSGHSRNMGPVARASVQEYKKGFPDLNKPGQGKWLQDDYVKFIRFAQMKMDAVEEGVVGIITNHSWLDNPTFKGMRQSLMQTFDQIHVLDLHGNAKKKERAPDGGDDQNVFDIQQGVAISLFVKKPGLEKGVWHAELWGKRQPKYEACVGSEFSKMAWQKIAPIQPLFLFRPWDGALASKYDEFWSVRDIFAPVGDPAPGIVTTHDQFAISFSKEEAIDKVERLVATSNETEARRLFRLCSQSQWNYQEAKKKLKGGDWRNKVVPILYRPFDMRWTVWDSQVAVHRRERVMTHLLAENVALITSRQTKGETFKHVQVTDKIAEVICMSGKTSNNGFLFPLYLYDLGGEQTENLAHDFRTYLDRLYDHPYTPEEILGYIYAVLHAPAYRARYAEFLRIDFPRIPFPEQASDFESLSALGWELMQAHLLREVPAQGLGSYQGRGNNEVVKPRHAEAEEALYINETQYFAPVPAQVWNFHIGGYQVLAKYLKDRKGRVLTLDEINNVEDVANVLAFTIAQMAAIDAAYQQAFAIGG